MILEIATLNIKEGLSTEFENNFEKASRIISSMDGYISHELKKCIEVKDQYVLLVDWEILEHHEIGFRKSPEYQEWKTLLHHFYEPFPTVLHYR